MEDQSFQPKPDIIQTEAAQLKPDFSNKLHEYGSLLKEHQSELNAVTLGPIFHVEGTNGVTIIRSLIDSTPNPILKDPQQSFNFLVEGENGSVVGMLNQCLIEDEEGSIVTNPGDYLSTGYLHSGIEGKGIAATLEEVNLLLNQAIADRDGKKVLWRVTDDNKDKLVDLEEEAKNLESKSTEEARETLEKLANAKTQRKA